ncbi:MAG TPA: protein kinase, partial [Gemmatimonadales bacterium]|nr:protein kinase [Gemmatimonadales bacterium]
MTVITQKLAGALAAQYKLERHLGEGGMATVYLAHDLKHDRKVAVKVLRPELAAVLGHERFIQEIKTTANLQHPHILPLFDSGEAQGFLFYVMPFVEGETLREKLNRETQLGIDEAVRITTEAADALDYAHRHGVIHRDIKPENILLHDGRPLVADFGIALAVSAAAGGRMTETGLSLGTPHYMSPEQATAEKDLTSRSDVYSLGCVLYEMLTGSPPHVGSSAQQIIMKIVTDDARPVTDLRKSVPAHVAAATAKALEKLPADRFDSAKAFAEALTNPAFALATRATGTRAGVPVGARDKRMVALATAAAVLTLTTLWGFLRSPGESPAPVIRYSLTLNELVAGQPQFGVSLALSPDGSDIAFIGPTTEGSGSQVWVRSRDQLESRALPGSLDAHQPFFAPDGRRVAYINATGPRAIKVVSLGGEPPVTLVDSMAFRLGGAWGTDGYVYFSEVPRGGLARVPASGGAIESLSTPDSAKRETRHAWPDVLPNGKGVLVTVQRGNNAVSDDDDVGVVNLETGETRVLVRGLLGRYAATGHLVFVRFDGAVMAAPFDQDKLEITGETVPLFGGVSAGVRGPDFALSASGRLVFLTGGAVAERTVEVVWVDRSGRATPVEPGWTLTPNLSSAPAPSPDGSRLALSISGPDGVHIWIKPLRGGTLQRLTFDGALNYRPRWSPDGRSIVFVSNRESGGIVTKRADGSGPTSFLLDLPEPTAEGSLSRDGRWLLARTASNAILALRPGVDSVPQVLLPATPGYVSPRLSPDGRWLAYVSLESAVPQVYVKPFPNVNDGRWQISTEGAAEPVWAPSGRELFYRTSQGDFVSVAVTTNPSFEAGAHTTLFRQPPFVALQSVPTYDVTADGQRFVMYR